MTFPKPASYPFWKRLCYTALLCCLIFCVYVPLQYLLLAMTKDYAAMSISILPIILAGWLWSWKAAVGMGLLVFFSGNPLMRFVLPGNDGMPGYGIGVVMIGFYTLIGVLVGKISEMDKRLKAELTLRQDTERRLRISNNELVDFAHIASHDLQEPLRKVTAFGDRLAAYAGNELDDRAMDYLARMRNAATRMTGLLDGLMEYARITTKGSPFVAVNMDEVTSGVLDDLEVRIGETGGRIQKEPLGMVQADPLQMRQLIQNLVGNALKYHKPDVPPVVKVSSRITEDGGWYELTIADNGIGVAEEDREKAFGIFQRLVGKSEYEGTGVGLAICKKIAERHGGTICLEGKVGQGTVFTVRLPVGRNIPESADAAGPVTGTATGTAA